MSMILTAYNVIKPLPPEGSEEWLAMLPGWTGWKYAYGDNSYLFITNTYTGALSSISWAGIDVVDPTYNSSRHPLCIAAETTTSYLGNYMVITPCPKALANSNLPKYYIKDITLRTTNKDIQYWAIAGVNSLTLE